MKNIIDLFPKRLNTVYGCEFELGTAGVTSIAVCKVKKVRSTVVRAGEHVYRSIEEFALAADHSAPLFCSFNGPAVVTTKVIVSPNQNVLDVFRRFAPNADPNNFTIQIYGAGESEGYMCFVRNEIVGDVIDRLSAAGFVVGDITLGIFALTPSLAIIGSPGQSGQRGRILMPAISIDYANGHIVDIQKIVSKTATKILMGEEAIDPHDLISYCSALNFFLRGNNSRELLTSQSINEILSDFPNRVRFHRTFVRSFLTIAILLAIGLPVKIVLSRELTKSQQAYAHRASITEQEKASEVDRNKLLETLNDLHWPQKVYCSFFADRIGVSLPQEIVLISLDIFPLQSSRNVLPQFKFDEIKISGVTASPSNFALWVKTLEKAPWIKSISDQKFRLNSSTGQGEFSLVLQIGKI